MREYRFHVYILASNSRTLYIGMMNHLFARVMEHRAGKTGSFTARYRITRLVYVEQFKYVNDAIAREKELKDWRREKKLALIHADNAHWDDLAATWDQWQERMRRQTYGLGVPLLEPGRVVAEFGKADPSASLRDDSSRGGEDRAPQDGKDERGPSGKDGESMSRRIARSILTV